MFGTNSFNLVWEKVCAEVMDNQLQKPIGGLRLPVPLAEQYRDMRHKKLIDLIDKPQWSGTAPNSELFVKQAEDTLIPDLISIVNVDGNYQFVIFDAKYYNIQLSITKAAWSARYRVHHQAVFVPVGLSAVCGSTSDRRSAELLPHADFFC